MAARALLKQLGRSYLLADQDSGGGYFVATNPTPATAIAFAVNASFDVTKNLFVFKNPNPAGGLRMYLDYIKLICTVAPASATQMAVAMYIDTVSRYTSGGTLVGADGVVAPNTNGDSGVKATCGVYYATSAVITSPAAGANVRLVGRSTPRAVIPAVGDEILLSFGSATPEAGSSSGTAAGRSGSNLPPAIIGPGQWGVLTCWFPSNALTALSYEFEIGWAEF